MTNYLIYRHGSNAANQSMTPVMAIAIVAATSLSAALAATRDQHTVYSNQQLTGVPQSKAKSRDWNEVCEQEALAAVYAE